MSILFGKRSISKVFSPAGCSVYGIGHQMKRSWDVKRYQISVIIVAIHSIDIAIFELLVLRIPDPLEPWQ